MNDLRFPVLAMASSDQLLEIPKLVKIAKPEVFSKAREKFAEMNKRGGKNKQGGVRNHPLATMPLPKFLIGANLDRLPLFAAEWEVFLLSNHYATAIDRIAFARRGDADKVSLEGREKRRAMLNEKAFVYDLSEAIYQQLPEERAKRIEAEIRERMDAKIKSSAFTKKPLEDNLLAWALRKIGFPHENKSDVLAGVPVDPAMREFVELNTWIWLLAKVGQINVGANKHDKSMNGGMELAMAKVLQNTFVDLPIVIETRLQLGGVIQSSIIETIAGVTEIFAQDAKTDLVAMVQEAVEATREAQDAADSGGAEFDRKLAASQARNENGQKK